MHNIYFIQANDIYKGNVNSIYFPYATGCIIAHCRKNQTITQHFSFQKIIYSRVPIDELVNGLDNPFAVFFSTYIWNTEYNKTAAAAIKKKYPDCFVVFGGHDISKEGKFLEDYAYIDFLTHRFGEEPTEALLEHFLGLRDLADIDNISYREGEKIITTKYSPQSMVDYPSPYLTGVFDDIINDEIQFSAILETNRGCPNRCSYCDWGEVKIKTRLFPMDRIKAELDWFVEHKIEFVFCADANFCLFERDVEIAQYVVDCKEKYGYPQVFRVCFTKNKLDLVFQIGSMFYESGLDKAQTISFQSMNEKVLANVGRKNISTESFKRLMKQYNDIDIATHTELILGLPGETYDSFCKGIGSLLEIGQHYSFIVYPCIVLPNAEMGQEWYLGKFKIKTTRIPFEMVHTEKKDSNQEILEYGRFITQTYSMSTQEWVQSLIYSKYTQALHSLGLTKNIALFYRYEKAVAFSEFYQRIIAFSQREDMPILNKVYRNIKERFTGVVEGKNGFLCNCAGAGNLLWEGDEYVFLELYKDLKGFYRELEQCFNEEFGSDDVTRALFKYQFDVIKKLGNEAVTITSNYDFYQYFKKILQYEYAPLIQKRTAFSIVDKTPVYNLEEYAIRIVWFGRNKRLTDYSSSYYEKSFEEKEEE